MSFLELKNISVMYQKGNYILDKFSLSVEKGTFLSLLGPSGCGKTTTLRTVAGFLAIQSGELVINGKVYNKVPTHKRNIGVVFQNYALFPHLNVFDNVAFGLKMRKVSENTLKEKVLNAIETVGLKGFEKRLPAQLSGGQQQRVGIARAVVIEPDLLLMDEPLSNLDANLRIEMRSEIRRIQKEIGITTIYVTHDQSEAIAMSDVIAVLNKGKIEQQGSPKKLFYSPRTPFVSKFMGFQEIAHGTVESVDSEEVTVKCGKSKLTVKNSGKLSTGEKIAIVGRQKNLKLVDSGDENSIEGKVITKIFQGDTVLYLIDLGEGMRINSEISAEKAHWEENTSVFVKIDPRLSIAFSRGGN